MGHCYAITTGSAVEFWVEKEATITDEGVKVFGLPFNSPELQKFRDSERRKVAVYCDPDCTNEATVIIEGHPDPVRVELSWSEMCDMSIPEFLAVYEKMRASDPSNMRDERPRLARVRQEMFEFLRTKAIENGLARSYMTRAEAEESCRAHRWHAVIGTENHRGHGCAG